MRLASKAKIGGLGDVAPVEMHEMPVDQYDEDIEYAEEGKCAKTEENMDQLVANSASISFPRPK